MNYYSQFLDLPMDKPVMYGWFHLMWLGILIAAIILFIIKFKNTSDKTNRRIFIVFSILFFILEVYKQINFTVSAGNYQWYAFPFQFCSTPIYLFPIMIFLKEGKLKNAFYNFIGTFIFVAGISVMVYPVSVYTSTLGINIQTMIHHSLMILAGIYVMVSGRANLTYKGYVNAVLVFIGFVCLADTMNVIFHKFIIPDHTFNMFMISPYYHNNMPFLMTLKEKAPYLVFLLSYLVSFSMFAIFALYLGRGIKTLIKKQVFHGYYRHLKLLFKSN